MPLMSDLVYGARAARHGLDGDDARNGHQLSIAICDICDSTLPFIF